MSLLREAGECRRNIRLKASNGTYVLLKSETDQEIGFLVDISKGGLSFDYIHSEETFKTTCEIDIILEDKNICVENLPCKKIFDIELEDEYSTPVKMRRIGLKFEELSPKQLSDLVYLINNCLTERPLNYTNEPGSSQHKKRDMIKFGAAQSDCNTLDGDDIFLSRLKLLIIAAKAYLENLPMGTFRKKAIANNAKVILKTLTQGENLEYSFRRMNTSVDKINTDYILNERIVLLAFMAKAFAEDFPIGSYRNQAIRNSIDFICRQMGLEHVSADDVFLKVA